MKKATLAVFHHFRRATNRNQSEHTDLEKDIENVNDLTKITNLNMDCLELILKYLHVVDLLNVADTCKALRQAAIPRLHKYKEMKSDLSIRVIKTTKQTNSIESGRNKFTINNLTGCLRFLRWFGHNISELSIDYRDMSDEHSAVIDHYINEYCAQTLEYLKIYRARKETMRCIQKPFKNIFELQFSDCDLAQPLINIRKWFPDVCRVTFVGFNQIALEKYKVPRWRTEIHIELENQQMDTDFETYVKNLLQPKGGYNRLCISGDGWTNERLQSVSKHLRNTRKLQIQMKNTSNEHELFENLRSIHFKRVSDLSFRFEGTLSEHQLRMPPIPFTFDRLKSITIWWRCKIGDDFLEFISKQAYLKKFEIYCVCSNPPNERVDIRKLAKALSKLDNIFLSYVLSWEEAKRFVNQCKFLRKFRFKHAVTKDFESFKESLANKWKISITSYGYVEMQR